MRCGERCYYVTIEKEKSIEILPVNARTPAEARKTVRSEYGRDTTILTVKKKN